MNNLSQGVKYGLLQKVQGSLQGLQGTDTVFTVVEPASQIFEESTVLHVGTYCAQLL